jgi:DNA polymerase III subunit epsilon
MFLFFDCETTGKPLKGVPPWAPGQPRIVQLCALLCDEQGQDVNLFAAIIKPDKWTIPPELAELHGITQELAERVGIPIKTALSAFRWFAAPATKMIAHSADFDADRVNGELYLAGIEPHVFEVWGKFLFCTKLAMMPVCKLEFAERKSWSNQEYRWPSLEEAHVKAFGEKFAGAHNAFHDVYACKRVFFWMLNKGLIPTLDHRDVRLDVLNQK